MEVHFKSREMLSLLTDRTRERLRVEAFNSAFCTLRQLLPTLPPDKKLSKIEILRLAICYITYLNNVLDPDAKEDEDYLDCCF